MGLRGLLYWIDRALAGDRRPLAALAAWLVLALIGATAYHFLR